MMTKSFNWFDQKSRLYDFKHIYGAADTAADNTCYDYTEDIESLKNTVSEIQGYTRDLYIQKANW